MILWSLTMLSKCLNSPKNCHWQLPKWSDNFTLKFQHSWKQWVQSHRLIHASTTQLCCYDNHGDLYGIYQEGADCWTSKKIRSNQSITCPHLHLRIRHCVGIHRIDDPCSTRFHGKYHSHHILHHSQNPNSLDHNCNNNFRLRTPMDGYLDIDLEN